MKGFAKILEAIIASIILLTSLTFFFQIGVRPTEWDDALLQIRAEDILYTLVKNGTVIEAVQKNNPTLISNAIEKIPLVAPTLDYSFEVKGVPNPVIFVGCAECSDAEVDDLKTRLKTRVDDEDVIFTYKSRQIEIRVDNDTLANPREETNILFLFGHINLNPFRSSLDKFLKRGGTIFMLATIDTNNINDGYMDTIFGLSVTSGATQPGAFDGDNDENRTTFKVAKYYRNITGPSPTFSFSAQSPVSVDERTVVIGSTNSLVKINKEILNGNGRTVWFERYEPNPTMNKLLKATIMWASGEKFKLDVRQKIPAARNIRSSVIVGYNDTYEASITLWRIFG